MPPPVEPPGRVRRLAELTGLAGIVLAEPVLTALREGADVFVSRRAEPWHVVVLTLALVFAVPLTFFLLEELVGLLRRGQWRDDAHRGFLGALGGFVVVRLLAGTGVPGWATVVLALLGGLALLVAVTRWQGARLWLQYLGTFPLLLAAWFLATDPVRGLLLGDGASGETAAVGEPAPVVLVVLDELPLASLLDETDRIDRARFPNLAALAEDATWFRNTTGVSPTTPEAVPPILTGRYNDGVGLLPTLEEHPDNLFTLLRDDYDLHVQESVTQLCPPDLCPDGALATGHPLRELALDALDLWQRQLFGGADDRAVEFAIRQSDPDAPATIQRFADGIDRDGDRPALDVLHAVYPHQPWYHLPDGLTYEAPFIAEGLDQYAEYAWRSEFAAGAGRTRHLLQARHLDAMLGTVLSRLRELDTYDESLIVLTADHGAAFEPGEPIRGVSTANADSVLWVPLLVKPPGQVTGRIDDRPATTVDVLPTIADVIDMDLPDDIDGTSLLSTAPVEDTGPDRRRVYDWGFNRLEAGSDGYSVIDGRQGFADLLAQPPHGEGVDPDLAWFRFGRHGGLVGREVDDLDVGGAGPDSYRLDRDGSYESSAPAVVDAYVGGTLSTAASVEVAIAVNGTIAGWSETLTTSRGNRFWTLAPPPFLRDDGEDVVEVFLLEPGDGPGGVLLRPLARSGG